MPHIRFRGLEIESVQKINVDLLNGLTAIIQCDRSWFTTEFVSSIFIDEGKVSKGYPFVEILWFDRGQEIKSKVAKFITDILKKEGNYLTITVIFNDLNGNCYYENGEHF